MDNPYSRSPRMPGSPYRKAKAAKEGTRGEDGKELVVALVSHGVQLRSLWIIPAAAVS